MGAREPSRKPTRKEDAAVIELDADYLRQLGERVRQARGALAEGFENGLVPRMHQGSLQGNVRACWTCLRVCATSAEASITRMRAGSARARER